MLQNFEEIEKKVLEFIDKDWRKYVKILADLISVDTVSAVRSNNEMMKGANFYPLFYLKQVFKQRLKVMEDIH